MSSQLGLVTLAKRAVQVAMPRVLSKGPYQPSPV